jgi:hypothetical protein
MTDSLALFRKLEITYENRTLKSPNFATILTHIYVNYCLHNHQNSYGLYHPEERYFLVGEKLIMKTSETGQTHQWLKDGYRIMDGPDYDGTTTKILTIKRAPSTSEGIYTCSVDGNVVTRIRQILSKSTD